MTSLVWITVTLALVPWLTSSSQIYPVPETEDPVYWNSQAQDTLRKALDNQLNTNVATNVILFIGDGWGVATVTAARILKGQTQGNSGEETVMEYEKFPHMGLIKTYSTDMMTADSSATATAMLCGIKTRDGIVGLDGGARPTYCPSEKGHEVDSILDWSLVAGKSVGIVSSIMVTHATPAAAYAHSAFRWWMTDTLMAEYGVDPDDGCTDIAHQLVVDNPNIQVILGGGRGAFFDRDPADIPPEEYPDPMYRSDGLDLIEMWIGEKESRGVSAEYVKNTEELNAVDANKTDYLLGLFSPGAMAYEIERNKSSDGEPSLAEMMEKAIQILSRNPKGYFLLVEGGKIDSAHHKNMAKRALYEALAFEEAVKKARQQTNQKETLIVVTADHGHSLVIAGNTLRGTDILGKVVFNHLNNDTFPTDGKPRTVLLYANGASYNFSYGRPDITNIDTNDNDYRYQMAVPTPSEKHGGADVSIYAVGPMSHLFFGTQEQNYIAHALAYASCVGNNTDHCKLNGKAASTLNPNVITTPSATLNPDLVASTTNDGSILNPSVISSVISLLLFFAIRQN